VSGLAVIVGPAADAGELRRMLGAAPHRGAVTATHVNGNVALGVQAPDEAPVFSASGLYASEGIAVAVAGCLYRGSSVVSGDAAARQLASAWSAAGGSGLAALRGAFAGVIVADDGGQVVAVRSQTGERPLFRRSLPDGVALASEVKQLRALDAPRVRVDAGVLLDHIAIDFRDTEATPWVGIRRVPAASWMLVGDEPVRRMKTWDPRRLVCTSSLTLAAASVRFRELLRQAVARRLEPAGAVLMSGGLDSTAVAVEAARVQLMRSGEPLPAISALFGDYASADETPQIRATVKALGLRGIEVRPQPRPFRDVDAALALHEAPSVVAGPDSLVALLDAASAAGCRSALDGNDGDSLFGPRVGIERALVKRRALRPLVDMASRTHAEGASWGAALRSHFGWALLPRSLTRAYMRLRGERPEEQLPAWLVDPLRGRILAAQDSREAPDWHDEQARIYDGMLEILLEVLERIGLEHSVTLLHPLADLDLVEFFLTLPPEVKFSGGVHKGLVRCSFPELPAIVRRRQYKPHFDDVASAGADPAELEAALAAGPRALPGVDWDALATRAHGGDLAGPEVAMIVRTLQADHLLAA
jgi:asparagine synthase (glutamine-hydrolysing)